jgi:hypothetical protein
MVQAKRRAGMEDIRMAQRSKRDYLQSIHNLHQQATRAEKQAILDEFMKLCGYLL